MFSSVYLVRYQPLSANGTGATWVDPRHATRLGDFSPPVGESFTAYRVRYEDGGSFGYAMTLFNEGPLPVTITSIGEEEAETARPLSCSNAQPSHPTEVRSSTTENTRRRSTGSCSNRGHTGMW